MYLDWRFPKQGPHSEVHIYVHIHKYIYIYIYTYMYIHVYVFVYMYLYIYKCMALRGTQLMDVCFDYLSVHNSCIFAFITLSDIASFETTILSVTSTAKDALSF